MQANRNYIYAWKKRPFTSYPTAKYPKLSKFAITDMRQKTVDFFYCTARASTLVPAIILLIEAPLQKFPFIIPWLYVWAFQSCLHLAVCEEIDKLGGAYFFSNMPLRCSYPQLITLDIIAKRLDIYPPIWYDIVIYCHGMWIQHTNAYSFQWTGVGWHDCFSMTLHTIV